MQLVTKEKQIAELEIIVNKKEESMKTNLKNVIRIETSKNAKKINTSDEKMSDMLASRRSNAKTRSTFLPARD